MLDKCNCFAKDKDNFYSKTTICIQYHEAFKPQEFPKLNSSIPSWENTIGYVYSKMDNNIDNFRICAQFIGQFNNLKSRFIY